MGRLIAAASILAISLLYAGHGNAQATRTWVSGVGDDVNPCSRTAPCKTFAGAISKTAAGGEISVLDPGGYGTLTITKSISIVAVGAEGSILASGTSGVMINAAPTDVVQIDGILFEGAGTGVVGIRIVSAAAVHIRRCVIRGFQAAPGLGVEVSPATATRVFISDCTVTKNTAGIQVKPSGTGSAQVFLERVQLENNAIAGLRADGAAAAIQLNQSTITNNGIGIETASGGSIVSFGNNAIFGNEMNGGPSDVQKLK